MSYPGLFFDAMSVKLNFVYRFKILKRASYNEENLFHSSGFSILDNGL